MKLCVILAVAAILPVDAEFVYEFTRLITCSESVNESQYLFTLDGNEIIFADYATMQQISRLPPFADPVDFPQLNDFAVIERHDCLQDMNHAMAAMGSSPEDSEPPEVSIYPKRNVVPGAENNFICFMKNFYPPHITVTWMRNGESVTEGVYNSQHSMNTDGTFDSFSILTSSPTEGDEYSCTVDHEALDSPQTRTWDEPVVIESVTPTVVFAVGIAVGILGLATGMFFVIKASCSC